MQQDIRNRIFGRAARENILIRRRKSSNTWMERNYKFRCDNAGVVLLIDTRTKYFPS